MDKLKKRGIKAGLVVFIVFMLPWLLWSFVSLFFTLSPPDTSDFLQVLAGMSIITAVSILFGYSIASNSKVLKTISSILVAAIPLTFIMLFIFFNFIE